MYTAEIAPPTKRGLLGAIYQISVITGVFLSYVVGAIPHLTYTHSALIHVLGLSLSLPLVLFIKESPRWLLLKHNKSAARKSLLWLFQSDKAAKLCIELIEETLPATRLSLCEKIKMLQQRSVFVPFLLSTLIVIFHQFTGNNVIINYAASIFKSAKVDNGEETAIYAIGLLQIAGACISAFVVDKVGRKKLLLFGSVGITVSNAALGTHLYLAEISGCTNGSSVGIYNESYDSFNSSFEVEEPQFNVTAEYRTDFDDSHCHSKLLSFVPIASVMGFGLFYSIGWRALPFILIGEMFPNTLRGSMNGFMAALLWVLVSILIGGFTTYENAVGSYTAWWTFAFIAALSVPLVAILVPETKGKTLEEIKVCFDGKERKKRKVVVATVNPTLGINIESAALEQLPWECA